jgi:hypothetical protein
MPDKRYVKGCGKSCVRCWNNRLKHGSKLKKKCFPNHFKDDNEEKKEKEEKKYSCVMEEFIDKYIISNYTRKRMNEIDDEPEIDYKLYNEDLIKETVLSYNTWIFKENKGKKIKEKDLIRLMEATEGFNSYGVYFSACIDKYNDHYMFNCIYK